MGDSGAMIGWSARGGRGEWRPGASLGPCSPANDAGWREAQPLMRGLKPIPLDEIRVGRESIGGVGTDSRLVRLDVDDAPAEIQLTVENLEPIGSFKLRGAGNLLQLADRRDLRKGVWTAGAGNMAQGVVWFDTLERWCYTVGCCPRGSRPVGLATGSHFP